MKRDKGKRAHRRIILWICLLFCLLGSGTTSSCFTDFDSVVSRFTVDKEPPSLQIMISDGSSQQSPIPVPTSQYVLTGTAFDEGSGVAYVQVNGNRITVDDDGSWQYMLELQEDVTVSVTIRAVDRMGNATTETIYLYVFRDETLPFLTVITPAGKTQENPTYAASSSYMVTGTASDDDEISQVRVNGISATRQDSGSWWCPMVLEDGVTQRVEVAAVDRSGNTVTEIRYVRYDSTIQFEEFTVTQRNRHKIGYATGMTELEIPETFYDEETATWYHVVAIGFQSGDPTSAKYAAFANETALKKVIIPGSVREIQRYAMYNATGIQELLLGYGIQQIGSVVFHGCVGLTEVSLPNSITLLDDGVFMMCDNLERVNLPANLTELSPNVFGYCSKLAGQMIIPKNVRSIGKGMFRSTNITHIYIPASVTSIEEGAFRSCGQLTEVYYEGTPEQWGQITFGKYNEAIQTAQIYYQYEGGYGNE